MNAAGRRRTGPSRTAARAGRRCSAICSRRNARSPARLPPAPRPSAWWRRSSTPTAARRRSGSTCRRILRGDTFWGQGFSEPNAGSDLASLRTRAERDGDHYIVNGQKTWTTEGHYADWLFCLVRTDPSKPQRGISFLLVDARSPGITIRPIISIDDAHSLNEVFFDDVRVPVANRIGEEGQGWSFGKLLL